MKAPSVDTRPNAVAKRGQDLTGHICFNSEQSRSFLHHIEKDAKINAANRNGTNKYKVSRNPLRAEATPRVDYKDFDFNPPPAEKVPERWIYPETDWGLMLKFASQKETYQELEETAKRCETKIREFREAQKLNAANRGKELEKSTARVETARAGSGYESMTGRNSSRSNLGGSGQQIMNSTSSLIDSSILELEANHDDPPPPSHRARSTNYMKKDDLYSSKVSAKEIDKRAHGIQTLKYLRSHNQHPEVLEKFRAERAAAFVKKQKHALEPPTGRELPHCSFKPGGGDVNMANITAARNNRQEQQKTLMKGRTRSEKTEKTVDTARLKEQLGTLMDQLQKTEGELAQQELKIALNHKTHNYEQSRRK